MSNTTPTVKEVFASSTPQPVATVPMAGDNVLSANTLEENLNRFAETMKGGAGSPVISVRDLVTWSGYRRRRGNSEQLIQSALDKLNLCTLPDFRDSHISAAVTLQKVNTQQSLSPNTHVISPSVEKVDRDAHILKVGRLEAASRKPISVPPGAPIVDATSLMIKHNYSQLPIMSSERRAEGIVSWQSISNWVLKNGNLPKTVNEGMLPIKDVSFDAALFDTIATILAQECVLVRRHDNIISGIITAADLGIQFSEMSEAFLKIGQIEAILRIIIDKYYPIDEIKGAKDPSDTARTVESVDDLTFGEYKRLLENEQKWSQYFKINISRRIFIATLDEVRLIRNDVMHFDPTGIEDEDISILSTALSFLNSVKEMM